MTILRHVSTRGELDDYERGLVDGLVAYAWWKDGGELVGTTGRSLNDAVVLALRERGIIVRPVDVRHLR